MSLITVQNAVDAEWASFSSIIETVNDDYLADSGGQVRFQQLWSHFAPPTIRDNLNGGEVPDNMTASPTDQNENPNDVGIIILTPIIYRFKQNTFSTPAGIGYYVVLSFIYFGDGLEHQKNIHMDGPDIGFGRDWYPITGTP